MAKWVYAFGNGSAEANASMKNLLGGKGANLAEMSNLGLPVPPGFTISTEVCTYYYAHGRTYPGSLKGQIAEGLRRLEKALGRRLGGPTRPLLVSVRSGARASMPGMMDTILNLGLNDKTVAGLVKETGNARFAYDSDRRFGPMDGGVGHGRQPEGEGGAGRGAGQGGGRRRARRAGRRVQDAHQDAQGRAFPGGSARADAGRHRR